MSCMIQIFRHHLLNIHKAFKPRGMAYRCSGNTNEELISKMRANELIDSDIVAEV